MQFEAEVKSGGFRIKTVKEGPPVLIREVKLLIDSSAKCLDEIAALSNQVVRVQLDKVQLSFGEEPYHDLTKTPALPLTSPKTTKRVRRKSALKD